MKIRQPKGLLKYGEMTVETPVFDTGEKRLQPEYATGFLLDSRDTANLHVQAGRFSRFKNLDASSGHNDFSGYGAPPMAERSAWPARPSPPIRRSAVRSMPYNWTTPGARSNHQALFKASADTRAALLPAESNWQCGCTV
ncbi:outer membrane porin, OprD family [compost metagenome]